MRYLTVRVAGVISLALSALLLMTPAENVWSATDDTAQPLNADHPYPENLNPTIAPVVPVVPVPPVVPPEPGPEPKSRDSASEQSQPDSQSSNELEGDGTAARTSSVKGEVLSRLNGIWLWLSQIVRSDTTTGEAGGSASDGSAESAQAPGVTMPEEKKTQWFRWMIAAVVLCVLMLVWLVRGARRFDRRVARQQAQVSGDEAAPGEQPGERGGLPSARTIPDMFLEGELPNGTQARIRLPGESIAAPEGAMVGRSPSQSEFVINAPTVGRRQFRIFIESGSTVLENLGATNGLSVDGRQIGQTKKARVSDGSMIGLGKFALQVRIARTESPA